MKFKSDFLNELQWRGFISQITHPQELDDLMSREKISAYIGFDCTADSLHVGSLIQIMILRMLQKHGHKPIVLLGGGTTRIGDPSGKDEARQILSDAKIEENSRGIYGVLAKFIEFNGNWIASATPRNDGNNTNCNDGENVMSKIAQNRHCEHSEAIHQESNVSATIVNNDNWLRDLNYIDFLRNVGQHFSVNRMLSFDSVRTRLERDQPLSFLEFNYMILQAYDFYVLNRDMGCHLQIGGSDQWGNIVNGVELIRRKHSEDTFRSRIGDVEETSQQIKKDLGKSRIAEIDAFGLTSHLLTTSDGKKMGKTANGAVWLDATKFSPFEYFQYFRNTTDADTIKFLKLFTALSHEEISSLENLQGQEINKAKEILAYETTKICHGENAANDSLNKAREIFISKNSAAFEEKEITIEGSKKLIEIMKEIGACESNGEARRLIEGRGVKIDGKNIEDVNLTINEKCEFNLQVGKKKFFKIIAV